MKRLLVCVVGLVLLTACGGGASDPNTNPDPNNPPGGNTQTFKQLGFVTVSESSFAGGVERSSSGIFFEPLEPTPVATNDQLIPEDDCLIITDPSSPDPEPKPEPRAARTLDAGAALTLTGPSGLYTTLPKLTGTVGIFYSDSGSRPPELPANLTLTVPGATNGFPAFTNIAMPTIPADYALTLSGNEGKKITSNTTFTWTGQGSSNTVFGIIAYDFSRVTPTGSETLTLICYAKDDGSFAFSNKTKSELDASGFTNIELSTTFRQASSTQTNGDAALVLSVQRAKAFE